MTDGDGTGRPRSDEPLRLGIVGLGQWARVIASAARTSPRLELVACYGRTPEARAAFAAQFGCAEADSLEALLADPRVEAVAITTPNDAHAPVAEAAAAAGKHLWIEKPLANTLEDAGRILAAVRRSGVCLTVGHSARFLSGSRALRRLVEGGELGDVVLAEANFSTDRALTLTPESWRFHASGSPGGPLIQLAVHLFDLVAFLAGPVERVSASLRRLHTRAEVPDLAGCLCELRGGALAWVGSSWVSPGVFGVRLCGTRANATLTVDQRLWDRGERLDSASRLTVQRPRQDPAGEPVPLEPGNPYRLELEELALAVREGREPEVTGEVGLHALAAVHAALRSAASGRAVALDDVLAEAGLRPHP